MIATIPMTLGWSVSLERRWQMYVQTKRVGTVESLHPTRTGKFIYQRA